MPIFSIQSEFNDLISPSDFDGYSYDSVTSSYSGYLYGKRYSENYQVLLITATDALITANGAYSDITINGDRSSAIVNGADSHVHIDNGSAIVNGARCVTTLNGGVDKPTSATFTGLDEIAYLEGGRSSASFSGVRGEIYLNGYNTYATVSGAGTAVVVKGYAAKVELLGVDQRVYAYGCNETIIASGLGDQINLIGTQNKNPSSSANLHAYVKGVEETVNIYQKGTEEVTIETTATMTLVNIAEPQKVVIKAKSADIAIRGGGNSLDLTNVEICTISTTVDALESTTITGDHGQIQFIIQAIAASNGFMRDAPGQIASLSFSHIETGPIAATISVLG